MLGSAIEGQTIATSSTQTRRDLTGGYDHLLDISVRERVAQLKRRMKNEPDSCCAFSLLTEAATC